MKERYSTFLRRFWMVLIVGFILYNILFPDTFSRENIVTSIQSYGNYGWAIFFLFHIIRGFVMLPSTVLIFAGVYLFPNNLFLVLLISVVGIVISSMIVYYFADKLGFAKLFDKNTKASNLVKEKLSGQYGPLFIIFWAFFPFVPTDLICYVAGAMRINPIIFGMSIFIGELILCSVYIYGSAYFI
ncbi:putative membrane protein YdjX (TVP38/TMEM64 family) [Kordia periserrulae]|uniref:Putative membrane protein YdjX (TVP38/TMEM64 family) n=1 Tax=Kordia periserrulae TaxID=701523 RepID=A0A2T6C3D8_9FLAO|nr:VTT domain-containing protein [Kordia periserrulae]PTX62841.1 putative membrane protein YdjX (TVP38/TMEM64 family) [Kordia periserrulae]